MGDDRSWKRFWSKVEVTGICWNWLASKNNRGYGTFSVTGQGSQCAHKVAWELLVGPVPEGLVLDHLCRNRGCVNPDHLQMVTNSVNLSRGCVGRTNLTKTHCPSGHPYSGDNLYVPPSSKARMCRTCNAARAVSRRLKRKTEPNGSHTPNRVLRGR